MTSILENVKLDLINDIKVGYIMLFINMQKLI